jgi:hypothetical protein
MQVIQTITKTICIDSDNGGQETITMESSTDYSVTISIGEIHERCTLADLEKIISEISEFIGETRAMLKMPEDEDVMLDPPF